MLAVGALFCYFGGHTIVKEAVVTRYRKFRRVNKLVETKYKTIGAIIWISCHMIAKMYWINFLQWLNKSLVCIEDGKIILSYVVNGKLYKDVITTGKGPSRVMVVIDENSNDASDEVIPFMGPLHNWHNKEFSPSFWKKQSLTFELSDGTTSTFSGNEVIAI
jgi:hypothetical protein